MVVGWSMVYAFDPWRAPAYRFLLKFQAALKQMLHHRADIS